MNLVEPKKCDKVAAFKREQLIAEFKKIQKKESLLNHRSRKYCEWRVLSLLLSKKIREEDLV